MGTVPPTKLMVRRIISGLSVAELARAIGRSPRWLVRLEHGVSIPREDAELIAAVFGIAPEKLFTDGGPLRGKAA